MSNRNRSSAEAKILTPVVKAKMAKIAAIHPKPETNAPRATEALATSQRIDSLRRLLWVEESPFTLKVVLPNTNAITATKHSVGISHVFVILEIAIERPSMAARTTEWVNLPSWQLKTYAIDKAISNVKIGIPIRWGCRSPKRKVKKGNSVISKFPVFTRLGPHQSYEGRGVPWSQATNPPRNSKQSPTTGQPDNKFHLFISLNWSW